jgi:hypothetical protein
MLPRVHSTTSDGQQNGHDDVHAWAKAFAWIRAFAQSEKTSGESARDFLARERTFFSWLRLSTMLAVASSALFFRLQIKDLSGIFNKHDASPGFQGLHNALQQKALRRRSMASPVHQYPLSVSTANASINLASLPPGSASRSILDTNIILSRGLGIAFLVVALCCLTVGYVDYIRCERALEHADKVVPLVGNNGDDEHPENVERREVARKWHDGRMARDAHSSM